MDGKVRIVYKEYYSILKSDPFISREETKENVQRERENGIKRKIWSKNNGQIFLFFLTENWKTSIGM